MKKQLLCLLGLLFYTFFCSNLYSQNTGTSLDQDSNSFEWIKYGDQYWSVVNAEVETYRDGTPIPYIEDQAVWKDLTIGAWCYYENDSTDEKTYGKLYNWYAVAGIFDEASLNDASLRKEFAPTGFRVPNNDDWNEFYQYMISAGYNFDNSTSGNKLAKSLASVQLWNSSDVDGSPGLIKESNNSSLFNAIPVGVRGGCCFTDYFSSRGIQTYFWSKNEHDQNNSVCSYINFEDYKSNFQNNFKTDGYSVRFVSSEKPINNLDILLNGTVSAEDNQIKNVADPTDAQDVATKNYVDIKTSEISNSQNFSNNSQIGLTGVVYDFEGNRYETVIMCDGKQWTTQYLNVSHFANGEQIPEVTGNEAWRDLTTPAWCYSYNQDNGRGKIYNGFALTDERGLAPEGWHIATEEEWNDLIDCLGGTEVAGGKLKISGTQYWTSPNVGSGVTGKASNSSGMSLLPDGFREGANGNFYSENEFVSIWNYSNIPDRRPFVNLLNDKAEILKGLTDPYDGAHILLVKD